jgi:hypothetical protein
MRPALFLLNATALLFLSGGSLAAGGLAGGDWGRGARPGGGRAVAPAPMGVGAVPGGGDVPVNAGRGAGLFLPGIDSGGRPRELTAVPPWRAARPGATGPWRRRRPGGVGFVYPFVDGYDEEPVDEPIGPPPLEPPPPPRPLAGPKTVSPAVSPAAVATPSAAPTGGSGAGGSLQCGRSRRLTLSGGQAPTPGCISP